MRPSGPTESDQHVSESGCWVNGYHLTGYGVSFSASGLNSADLSSAATAGARPAASTPLLTFMKVRRSICPDPIELLSSGRHAMHFDPPRWVARNSRDTSVPGIVRSP